jgi:outer membrane protein OmpA-like peptidoglycan-associated protein
MEEHPTVYIEVRGHISDAAPGGSINLVYSDFLSQERAEEVAFYLARRGIDTGRIHYRVMDNENLLPPI